MSLKQEIMDDMKEAMRNKDKDKVKVLRMLRSEIKNAEIEKSGEFDDEDAINILSKAAKKRRESIEAYQKGKRDDLVDKEKKELKIIEEYLPEQLSDEEIKELVDEVIEEVNASGMGDMGKVMGTIMPKVKGKADGSKVQSIVRSKLT